MGEAAVGRVALMSIHPAYADAILAGRKRVEFRKRPIGADVTHVVVYATRPVGAVVGAFSVDGQQTTSPSELWRMFGKVGCITRDKFRSYYRSRAEGTGIKVGDVLVAPEPIDIGNELGVSRPPQSFQYLTVAQADHVLTQLEPAAN